MPCWQAAPGPADVSGPKPHELRASVGCRRKQCRVADVPSGAIGFTGTREGMTDQQQDAVLRLLLRLGARDLHHGDCIADGQVDQIGRELGLAVYLHPPTNPKLRSWCNTRPQLESWIAEPKPYLERNQEIVDATATMIATPKLMAEEARSGTWSTIRYAMRRSKPVYVVWPDGSIELR